VNVHQLESGLVRQLVAGGSVAAAGGPPDPSVVQQVFASAAWTVLVEPGDAVAGAVVAGLGADRALSMLLEQRPAADWIAALRSESAGAAGELRESDMAAGLERWRPRLSSRLVVASFRAAGHCGARLLLPTDDAWPQGFAALGDHAPLALWVRGASGALGHAGGSVAIVGSRDATSYGEHMAADLGAGVTDRGFAVVSGAAYGIDGIAHRACLASGGTTVAFLAGGVDRLYPAAHHDLLLRVAATGAVVSEVPCGSAPTKWRFLQRNRLIAAASDATIVVEAGRRSGSLNTAGHAAALGRPLGAVPGPVTSTMSAGCHRLLREYDAVCVTSAADIVELVLGPSSPAAPTLFDDPPASALSSEGIRVLDALSARSARGLDDLVRRTGMAPRSVAASLGSLAIEGTVRETATGWLRA
jgi:DNA processing protein